MNFITKQILSIALCIIFTVFSLPITVSADTGDTYKYQYAYDVARSPAFPKSGEKEALSAFIPAITILDNGKFDFDADYFIDFAQKNGTGIFAKYRSFSFDGELKPIWKPTA